MTNGCHWISTAVTKEVESARTVNTTLRVSTATSAKKRSTALMAKRGTNLTYVNVSTFNLMFIANSESNYTPRNIKIYLLLYCCMY